MDIKTVIEKLDRIESKMLTREQWESEVETQLILSNPDTMKQLRQSEKDFAGRRVREINSIHDL